MRWLLVADRYVEKQPGRFVSDSQCERLPVEVCGAGCTFQEGQEECHHKVGFASFLLCAPGCVLRYLCTRGGVRPLPPLYLPPGHQAGAHALAPGGVLSGAQVTPRIHLSSCTLLQGELLPEVLQPHSWNPATAHQVVYRQLGCS